MSYYELPYVRSKPSRKKALDWMGGPCIYVVGFADYIKIGWSRNYHYRIPDLEDALPVPLNFYALHQATMSVERDLHLIFAPYRLKGEWFRREGALAKWIDDGCPLKLDGLRVVTNGEIPCYTEK